MSVVAWYLESLEIRSETSLCHRLQDQYEVVELYPQILDWGKSLSKLASSIKRRVQVGTFCTTYRTPIRLHSVRNQFVVDARDCPLLINFTAMACIVCIFPNLVLQYHSLSPSIETAFIGLSLENLTTLVKRPIPRPTGMCRRLHLIRVVKAL